MPRKLIIKEAKERAGRFCAFRERSPNEVLEKTISWGISQEESQKLVAELTELNYIDEQRFANAFCNDKFEFNSWGKVKIKAAIYPHKISEKAIQEAMDRIDQDKYESRLFELAKKKWEKHSKEELIKRKQKTVAYLANKGFEIDLIWRMIGRLESDKGQK